MALVQPAIERTLMFIVESLEGREMFSITATVAAPPPSDGVLTGLLLPAVQKVNQASTSRGALSPSAVAKPAESLSGVNAALCDGSVRVG
jgi:hypothetical protein